MGIDKNHQLIIARQTIQLLHKKLTTDGTLSSAARNGLLVQYSNAQDIHTDILGDRYHEYDLIDHRKAWLERFYRTNKFNC